MLIDPVCGRKMNRARAHVAVEYNKVTYYLCCGRCQAEFEAAPERYAKPELGERVKSKAGKEGHPTPFYRPASQKGGGN